ncbi:putative arabinose 5-phosphate isomerase [Iris pallida]|uniref:Arabinose 5-phosphate isomerase n=1 Tax=Iris pallida TaxID=29817 RepID=A0AAX6IAP6_IRIPA|nr:putative arabinose 5-phosphate isomerase [Iris pallida]
MGSLPSPSLPSSKVDPEELRLLFLSQRQYMNHFFDAVSIPDALHFADALLSAPGAVFFTGVGKSGFVAQKLSQTLASLGGPQRSSFLSPVDALHGDLGSLRPGDLLILLSKSGSSAELLSLAPCARAKGATLLSLTSVLGNPLASLCDSNVHLPLQREACPFDLAPVTSTAVQMLFGDTVIAAIMRARKLTRDEYAANHPAGRIGKSLIFKVRDVMKRNGEVPLCREGDMIMDQLTELTSKGCGCLLVVDEGSRLVGTFTDGDLRRTLKNTGEGIFKLTVGEM